MFLTHAFSGPQYREVDGAQVEHNDFTQLKRQKLEFGTTEIVEICSARYWATDKCK